MTRLFDCIWKKKTKKPDDWSFVPNTKDWRSFIDSTLHGDNPEKQRQKTQQWLIALCCRDCKESSLTPLTLFQVRCCTAVSISERLNLGCWHFELLGDCQVALCCSKLHFTCKSAVLEMNAALYWRHWCSATSIKCRGSAGLQTFSQILLFTLEM